MTERQVRKGKHSYPKSKLVSFCCAATPERIVGAKRFMGKLEKLYKVRRSHALSNTLPIPLER